MQLTWQSPGALSRTELCSVVETMYSLSYIYRATGERSFADRCEKTAFNALPVMVMPDWWSHQYVAQTNQPMSLPLARPPFRNVNGRGQTYGLEPHYPCCTTNHPQGYPKFLSASFVKVGPNGLGHALLSPGKVSTTLGQGNDNNVTVDCETNYPFGLLFLYTIETQRPFDFYVRVPEWYIAEDSFARVSSSDSEISKGLIVDPDPVTGMLHVAVGKGTTKITYKLGARIKIEPRMNGSIAIHHGALLYALEIGTATTSMPALDWRYQRRLPSNRVVPQVHDHIIRNTTVWAVAIDPSTLRFQTNTPESSETVERLPNPIFQEGAPPTSITGMACEINWGYHSKGVPKEPPGPGRHKCISDRFTVKLVPYGAAKIHIAEFPTANLPADDDDHLADQPVISSGGTGPQSPLAREL
ncbi:hypothetical protein GP486_006148 [Trichoglossum hirsutum]|uniref:Uncharacterized protein n=1 Tax=Trichoglossum hirsutum TaxID=265104 RepID=A0A9P8L7W7_9PEZI|nr:hypothetical protein GP486_006148 [Trichoglossum hirsutum]